MATASLSVSPNSDKSPISQPDKCLFCREVLFNFGSCRLYSGWAFDLLHCAECGRWYSKPPSKPRGPFLMQAFTFAQIVAEASR